MSHKIKGIKDPLSISLKDMIWRDRAVCQSEDTSHFFLTPKSNRVSAVLNICHSCPVRKECFYEAMQYGYYGIWGGSTDEQRSVIIKTKLNSDLTSFDRSTSDSLLILVDRIGKTKNTALADILNSTSEENTNA